jgi:branched-chain amino acid transport system ATP-binding protein
VYDSLSTPFTPAPAGLQTDNISVQFGGVRAIGGAGFVAEPGRVTGLIGPNGAGKTTMFNVITGLQKPNTGQVFLNGEDVTNRGSRYRARNGLGRTFQRLEVFGSLSVRDNIMVALEAKPSDLPRRGRRAMANQLLARVGLSAVADTTADVLPTGTARLLEMARALACKPNVLLLDEASSGLDGGESERLGELMVELAQQEGMAVLLVEHDMDLVMRVCEYIYVLDFGEIIASGKPAEIRNDPKVQAAYLGTVTPDTPQELLVTEGGSE